VRLAASNDTLSAYDDDTAAVLRQLHPSRAAPTCDSQLQPVVGMPALTLSGERHNLSHQVILSRLGGWTRWSPTSASQGHDQSNHGHRRPAVDCVTDGVLQHVFGGCRSLAIRPILYGASLCALTKKGGGVRPIAVGSTLHRLVVKVACRSAREKMVTKLAPAQLGFSIQWGAEAAAHAARSFLSNLSDGQALLKIDFSNCSTHYVANISCQ
jgi:hypothetical protein